MKRLLVYIILSISILLSWNIKNLWNKKENVREFSFSYKVDLEPTNGKKVELWIPVPQSNEVQKISKLKIDTQGLKYKTKTENSHGNKYIYIYDINGID